MPHGVPNKRFAVAKQEAPVPWHGIMAPAGEHDGHDGHKALELELEPHRLLLRQKKLSLQ